eukprot:CAMPEP_0178906582 /NCGR_PEP_ID=MMETSP0786-20121207/6905_1 /TAXON_ID=186022 /ORGANISM="Thalassionema frauenfeldii, Strain CCMP 1798" /LENGTH=411 /DNA_ID=CAMNT_0020578305 /DNA_START=177 /DNA_END=1412 /DNA_ORIENTATION=+
MLRRNRLRDLELYNEREHSQNAIDAQNKSPENILWTQELEDYTRHGSKDSTQDVDYADSSGSVTSLKAVESYDESETNSFFDQTELKRKYADKKELSIFESIGIPADSVLLLNLVAVIWGSQHAVIKTCVSDIDPSSFSLVRFFLGALIATPGIWSIGNDATKRKLTTAKRKSEYDTLKLTLRWGAEMGLWMFLGYAFQAIGLEYTTAQKSGFLLYLNVKFVPFFAFLLLRRSISLPTWVSAFSAVIGTALLAYDGNSLDLNVGDLWSIAAAAASAMFILRLESASGAVSNSAALNAACLWFVAGASLIWTAQRGQLNVESITDTVSAHPWELFYLSAVTTALANWIQTKAQKNVKAERASVIYAMDPVWGALWANFLLGESLSFYGILGAAIITLAAATNAFLDFGERND